MLGSAKRVKSGIKSCLPPCPKIEITYHVLKSLKCDEYL